MNAEDWMQVSMPGYIGFTGGTPEMRVSDLIRSGYRPRAKVCLEAMELKGIFRLPWDVWNLMTDPNGHLLVEGPPQIFEDDPRARIPYRYQVLHPDFRAFLKLPDKFVVVRMWREPDPLRLFMVLEANDPRCDWTGSGEEAPIINLELLQSEQPVTEPY